MWYYFDSGGIDQRDLTPSIELISKVIPLKPFLDHSVQISEVPRGCKCSQFFNANSSDVVNLTGFTCVVYLISSTSEVTLSVGGLDTIYIQQYLGRGIILRMGSNCLINFLSTLHPFLFAQIIWYMLLLSRRHPSHLMLLLMLTKAR